jgi:hypothetical protein
MSFPLRTDIPESVRHGTVLVLRKPEHTTRRREAEKLTPSSLNPKLVG